MGDPVVLPVTFIAQLPGLCGAACAQMLLNARGIVSTSIEDQRALWADIQEHTQPTGPEPEGVKRSVCVHFDNQICERFGNGAQCWCTHPRALAATLSARLDGAPSFAIRTGTEDEVTARALDRIDRGSPSVMLVYGTRHWVVVNGYTPVESGGRVFGSHRVSHIHILNPEWREADNTRTAVLADEWTTYFMANALFGEFTGMCVVVTEGE